MTKIWAVIFWFFLMPMGFSFAQSQDNWASKIYSGYFHQELQNKGSFWHTFFGKKTNKPSQDNPDRQCWIEFKSPVSFTHQTVTQVPEKLAYFIRFKNDGKPSDGGLKKFTINILTDDDQEYPLDPQAEGKQIGVNEEHHIFDAYLIYLILGQGIDHLEVVSSAGEDKGKYILDRLEIPS